MSSPLITKDLPYCYRMKIGGIPARYLGYWAFAECDKVVRWGDCMPALRDDGAGSLAFQFKWSPRAIGEHLLTIRVHSPPGELAASEESVPEIRPLDAPVVMVVRVMVRESDCLV